MLRQKAEEVLAAISWSAVVLADSFDNGAKIHLPRAGGKDSAVPIQRDRIEVLTGIDDARTPHLVGLARSSLTVAQGYRLFSET